MDPALTSELEKDLVVSFARGGKKVSLISGKLTWCSFKCFKPIVGIFIHPQFFMCNWENEIEMEISTFFSFTEKPGFQLCGVYGEVWKTCEWGTSNGSNDWASKIIELY